MRPIAIVTAMFFCALACAAGALAGDAGEVVQQRHYEERPDDPPATVDPRRDPLARSPASRPEKDGFVSVQVNVDALGRNIVGDAANEPSIAVSLANPNVMVVGWRQFASITSNFREGGWAYTVDGGQSWTFPGVLEPGVFRSDPVLDSDSAGNVFYQSLYLSGQLLLNDVWKSTDGGQAWQDPVLAFGGDKNWITVDKSGGIGDGHVYVNWQIAGACCGDHTFSRSADGAASFETPVRPERVPLFGTSAVGPDGEVYLAGIDGQTGQNFDLIVVAKTTNAQDAALEPTFTGWTVDLGGSQAIGGTPNPQGLIGQINVAVDHSDGPTRGNVYVLGSVAPNESGNPADVHLIRSEDGGESWSAPVRVHGDPEHVGTWHWFGALSVAPNGRVDAVWYDTRNSGDPTISEVFYAYSHDGGRSWFGDSAVTPAFDSTVGWPQQNKLGDYIQLISQTDGADLIYAATFNGEQDVYYLRLFPDCNDNGIVDDQDVTDATSPDCNGNFVPDECELAGEGADDCNGNGLLDVCDIADGTSDDCDGDGVADECQPDCNVNGTADSCDIADETSIDCAGDGVPDECETDCNGNGKADSCDLFEGTSGDCNGDGVLDVCEPDCDLDDVPDQCQTVQAFGHEFVASAFGPAATALADLDGDGDPDVLAALLGGNAIVWYENLGAGTFGSAQTVSPATSGAIAAIAADLDGDGDMDVLSVSINDDKLAWYENLGGGAFGGQRVISTQNDAPVGLAAADLDGDFDVDVVATSINDNEVAWYENLGGGTFSSQQLLPSPGGRPRSVAAADVDHDGDEDLLVVSEVNSTVAWYANQGDGTFGGLQVITNVAFGAWSVAVADLDGDGDRDVVTASSVDNTVAWHANVDGTGLFGPRRFVATDRTGARLAIPGDVDGDGDTDIVSGAFPIDALAWHENDGLGVFAPTTTISDGVDGINGAAVGDVDGDGDTDIVSAALIGNAVQLHENLSQDCNGNGVPDSCEDDCDGNGIADTCDLARTPVGDCDASGVPDVCETECAAECDTDADGCIDDADSAPGDPASCGDTDADGCDDCSAGAGFDPATDGTNTDTDGICDPGDCAAADSTIWRAPGPVAGLTLEDNGFRTRVRWQRPPDPGAIVLTYDLLRSDVATDFGRAAFCVVTATPDTSGVDLELPEPGQAFYYLARGANDCAEGTGSLGADSVGVPRGGRTCGLIPVF